MNAVGIGDVKEPLFQETSSAMGYHAVALHFSETEATVSRSTFSRLASQYLCRASSSGMNLITYHVLKSLIECGS